MRTLSFLCSFLALMMLGGCAKTCCAPSGSALTAAKLKATTDNNDWFYLKPDDTTAGPHHLHHGEIYGKYVEGYNRAVINAIDTVQAHSPEGGGYFIGIKAVPTETPVGYPLALFGKPLIDPPRSTSYCSGSSYTAFIEALDTLYPDGGKKIDPVRYEALRMQEPDGGRREDGVKFWGHWNDDGFGSDFALVQYAKMGVAVTPQQARPGDFMNISWKSGNGHSVIFLGWTKNEGGVKGLSYWSSQTGTDGYGDVHLKNLDKISEVKIVRLTNPDNLFTFDPATPVDRKIPGDKIGG